MLALVGRLVSRRRTRHVGLVVHDASFGRAVAVFWLLGLGACSARFLSGDFAQVGVPVIFLKRKRD